MQMAFLWQGAGGGGGGRWVCLPTKLSQLQPRSAQISSPSPRLPASLWASHCPLTSGPQPLEHSAFLCLAVQLGSPDTCPLLLHSTAGPASRR